MSKRLTKRPSRQLLKNTELKSIFRNRPLSFVNKLRNELINKFPNLCEKVNTNSYYFGFSVGDNKDAIYIYLQKKKMVIDVDVSRNQEPELIKKGFDIQYRNNFQGQAGWLTGLNLQYNSINYETIRDIAIEALSNNQ